MEHCYQGCLNVASSILVFTVMLRLLVGFLFVATAFADELKVDVLSVPEICEEKSKAGDTVRVASFYLIIFCSYLGKSERDFPFQRSLKKRQRM